MQAAPGPRATIIFILLVGSLFLATVATFAAPNQISYQGRLTDDLGQPVADGSYPVDFRLYDASTSGIPLWFESAVVETSDGLFAHTLGSVTKLPKDILVSNDSLFLELEVDSEILSPRVALVSSPYALSAAGLSVTDSLGQPAIATVSNSHRLSVFGESGVERVRLQGAVYGELSLFDDSGETFVSFRTDRSDDSSVMLPSNAIGRGEIIDEPGIVVEISTELVTLLPGVMSDLIKVQIQTPASGYIEVTGKCYVMLSGTTGPNTAIIQIDETEAGTSLFPYFQQVGLGGYVNTETSYFPVYVTRTYFKPAGIYTFRMEGRAQNVAPALAQAWDHVITAKYYPTGYNENKAAVADPTGYPDAQRLTSGDPDAPAREHEMYKVTIGEDK